MVMVFLGLTRNMDSDGLEFMHEMIANIGIIIKLVRELADFQRTMRKKDNENTRSMIPLQCCSH